MVSFRFVLAIISLLLTLSTGLAAEPIILKGHSKAVTAITWASDGKTLVSGSEDRTIRTWDIGTGKPTVALKEMAPEGKNSLVIAFSADLKTSAVSYSGLITVRNMSDGTQICALDGIANREIKGLARPDVYAMSFSPDGKFLATSGTIAAPGGKHFQPGGNVIVWDIASGKPVHSYQKLSTGAGVVAWSPDGQFFAAGTNGAGGEEPESGDLIIWNSKTGVEAHRFVAKSPVQQFEWASAADVAFSPNGKKVAVPITAGARGTDGDFVPKVIIGDKEGAVRICDLGTGKSTLLIQGLKSPITRIVFSPDGKQLATAGADNHVRIWDAATGKELAAMICSAPVSVVSFSPKGDSLAAASKDGSIRIWGVSR